MFTGAIIKETVTDELILDLLEIEKAEIRKTDDPKIKYWTMIFFRSEAADFPQRLSACLMEGWFTDMKEENTKYIVFKDSVLHYEIKNAAQKEAVLDEMRRRGIPEEQFGWEE